MAPENLRVLGKLSKLHAFEGEAILISDWSFTKNELKTEWVFLLIDGLPVPFSVLCLKPRGETSAIIKLEDINSDKQMKEFIGLEVFVEEKKKRKIIRKDASVEGYEVTDQQLGSIGIAKTVLDLNKNFLLQVFKGEMEILIPVHENIILAINDTKRTITTLLPEGFMEIYD